MANFAQLDETDTILQVVVVTDDNVPDEATGAAFLRQLTGHVKWKRLADDGSENCVGETYGKPRKVAPVVFRNVPLSVSEDTTQSNETTFAEIV